MTFNSIQTETLFYLQSTPTKDKLLSHKHSFCLSGLCPLCVEYVTNSVYLQELTFDRVKLKKKNKNKKRKLKNCKFCRKGRGESKFAKTLGQSKLLKNQLTTALLKAYLWFTTDIPAKNKQLAGSS